MKKIFFAFVILNFSLLAFAQEKIKCPELLNGIWQNSNRYIIFNPYFENQNSDSENSIPQIVLKTFYGWYNDRAAENSEYIKKNPSDKNDSTPDAAKQELEIYFEPLTDEAFLQSSNKGSVQDDGDVIFALDEPSGAWNMIVKYPRDKNLYTIPIAVIGNELYLNFIIKKEDSDSIPFSPFLNGTVMETQNALGGFWQDCGASNGILISPPYGKKELLCYYIAEDSVYHLRYWRTDMEYDSLAQAFFSDGNETYSVPKHLKVQNQIFTCVNGRSSRIRNVQKSHSLSSEYKLNSILVQKNIEHDGSKISYGVRTSTICALGKPYLTLVPNSNTDSKVAVELLEQLIQKQNFSKKPLPPPLFPPHGILDFDWSIIERPPKDYNRRMLDLGK